jgi:tetratricopeptide (TPR) repeat protein
VRAVVLLAVTATPALAGVYHPLEKTPFPVTGGKAAEVPFGGRFDGPFPLAFTRWLNVADDRPRPAGNPDRQAVLSRLGASPHPADLIRLNRLDEAVNALVPLTRKRSPDFRDLANLAHAHAARGEWAEAASQHELAAFEVGLPADLEGATPEQRTWLTTVEREYYRRWLVEHRKRAARKGDPVNEPVFPLFPAGQPADAVAVVQQLLLWAPWDTALYWLLAELYAEAGRVREAAAILDQCVEGRQYSNRKALLARRAAVKARVRELPPEAEDEPLIEQATPPADPAAVLPSRRAAAIGAGVFGGFALLMLGLQARRWLRRRA